MTDQVWTIKAALDWTQGYLDRKGDENPRLSAEWLLAEATGMRRIDLYTHFDQPLSQEERAILRDYVSRRGQGEPLQYITGEVGFRHINVRVRPGVLIPRPETEVLVSEALSLLPAPVRSWNLNVPDMASTGSAFGESVSAEALEAEELTADNSNAEEFSQRQLFVADICTGSGCIAASIAYEHPQTKVFATDIAPECVALARENVQALNLDEQVEVIQCDLGTGIPKEVWGSLDVIVSNPPYVPTEVLAEIPREVADFEPTLALDGGADGLDVFRSLLSFSCEALRPGGAFAFELHETTLDEAANLAQEAGFVDVQIVHDLTQRPRILVARKPIEGSSNEL